MEDMKEESKFYVPSIEELLEHLLNEKFLYTKIIGDEGWKKIAFEANTTSELLKSFIEMNDWTSDNGYDINEEMYKLKHLDREDIESLGFKVMGGQMISGGRIDCQKPYNDPRGVYDKAMLFTPSNNWVMIAVGDDETSFHDWNTLFAGTIKNKSELKQVLKMIGV
jgi:hypothetical protein